MQHIHLKLNERAVLVRDGKPERALGPGRYMFWKHYEVMRFDTDELDFTAPGAVVQALPVIGTRRFRRAGSLRHRPSRRASRSRSCARAFIASGRSRRTSPSASTPRTTRCR